MLGTTLERKMSKGGILTTAMIGMGLIAMPSASARMSPMTDAMLRSSPYFSSAAIAARFVS